ncbi:alanine--tRNA ligase [Apilactobacillus micheneri]|uniref:Alanine--tRNA ligase n=1 Tax=Apilactobacillus micheneri TaxID=1899430 RepID=A0A9Q8IM93_9LACO|nr:alanine--tRNA ligase [Apilactobacillus micheneri]TPR39402.1 alanine--tRNA ligase [Apilactobacillus micheneri]TPR41604.1 alanine--tRNA ligase [Apilactobacillus micheneri]TPR43507.1 alanine--tRNA ligase [Apilactobacillus micheneri]TPR44416.1 alanine--tRNA ligase [Apilactobacillus micheneri]TPR44624.1 alanine--tRNA ligase [Apilactobacillus micheneri]
MKNLSSSQIRAMYLDFFKQHGHTIEPSASLVPKDDPSLLWINSGVATMKKYFDGSVVPKNHRLTSSQKSIRTNDIENVGKTARHHTLFEMLGNFSVGDYFKKEAITWAFELLTSPDWFGWDKDKLYMTVYPKDTDAKKYWEAAGVAPDHLIDMDDNFWDIGQGPSGPDTEVFYDRGPEHDDLKPDDPENYPGGENERYLEVWNIVFSQFNHKPDDTYEPLPRKNIDTGMGLERVTSIFQNAPTNFETDLFLPIIHKTEEFSNNKKYGVNDQDDVDFKIIADHARAITFAIGDGALPSNVGRGYVIRRLIRRAIVSGHRLGIEKDFLYKLVPIVGEIMKSYYPEVLEQKDYLAKVIHSEEKRFNETLSDGLDLLNNLLDGLKESDDKVVSGKDAFKLYDTYGFPLEMTREYLNDEGYSVDEDGFKSEMQKQKDRARNARGDKKSMGVQRDLLIEIQTPSKYVGYDQLSVTDAKLLDIIVNEKLVDSVDKGIAEFIFDKTPFYAEMGGQVADQGVIKDANGDICAKVTDVQNAPNGQNLHTVEVLKPMNKNNSYSLDVDRHFHSKVEKNHTATHLLDQSLRNILGDHTQQAGSLVEPNYLRFDFTHFGSVTEDDLNKVEELVNEQIFKELPVNTVETDQENGKKMGAIALFDNKYGDKVRVVSAGDFSVEFCGGNHVKNTNELGLFKITSESGVGAGVRRIEAVTSGDAFKYLNNEENILKRIAINTKTNKLEEVPNRINQLQEEIKELQQKQETLETKIANQQADSVFENVQNAGDLKVITGVLKVSGMGQLRQLADTWRNKNLSDVLVLGTSIKGKANLIVAVSDDQVKAGIKAGDLIKAISSEINGGGGGRPNLAQAGGSNPEGLAKAMDAAIEWLQKL